LRSCTCAILEAYLKCNFFSYICHILAFGG
jgi:hypothetical protein